MMLMVQGTSRLGSGVGLTLVFALVAVLCTGGHASGEGHACKCAHCACQKAQKTCRLVREEATVSIVVWGCLEEEFCVPGRSCEGAERCERIHEGDGKEGGDDKVRSKSQWFHWSEWIPKVTPSVHTRRKLMKRVVTKKVPSYRWKVEDLCAECQASVDIVSPSPDQVPALPEVEGDVKVLLASHREASDEKMPSGERSENGM